ncbi:MAG: GAF domain-containing protein, partial [Deltaproteobacteria bacterium]|nr:GAF domain-containing protein [Deltaproteobacteria bacterium]
MGQANESRREIEVLRERISALSAAILRINASLDLTTVLQEAVDSACALTAARYGIITTTDEAGEVREFVTSGFTPDEQRQFVDWPDGPKLFAHFRDLPGPIQLTDLPAFVRALGFSPELMRSKTFQGTPMRHRDVHVGNFFLAEKEGAPAFSDQDEEILLLFASQAATAITNARIHHDERQTRADLEALIEISPVGVVVFDARSGRPASFNREARRIVEGLRTAGRPMEELLDTIAFRRADGREVSLSEFPITELLSIGETLRGEEVEFSVPDGRSVRTLINSTSIRSADGGVASVVVTMQDLAPLEELERLRTEFLSLV